jgi:uncharacterized membrane protein YgcG
MMMRTFAGMTLLALLSSPVFAQSSDAQPKDAQPKFEIADVHTSPHRTFPFGDGGSLHGDRYAFHQATMLDLIAYAYGLDPSLVQGGPIWLETDRFDVIAKATPKTSKEDLKLMVRSLLAERFSLVTHTGSNQTKARAAGSGSPGGGGAGGASAGGGGSSSDGSASDPSGALTLFDAVNRQLGLKLEKQRRPAPVLVIDHIEEKPTEN